MNMRVLTSVAAAAVLAVSLSACQKKAEEANTGNTEVAAPVETMNTETTTTTDTGNMAAGNMEAGNIEAGNMGNTATGNAQ